MRNQIDRRKITHFNTILNAYNRLKLLRQVIDRMKEDRIRCIVLGPRRMVPELDFAILQTEVRMLSAYINFLKLDITLTAA